MKRFIDIHVPITSCNLNCHYCYVRQMCKNNTEKIQFDYSPEYVAKALSKERLGGASLLNVCGLGETLLPKEILDYIQELLKEHYLMIVTNGTITKRFEEISKWDFDLLKRLFFKFSFHYLELKKTNQMDIFFSNVKKMKASGCSFTVEITPNDELEPYIDEIKEICMKELGALCHVTIPRKENDDIIPLLSNHSFEEFCDIWSTFDSELFDFKKSIWSIKRNEFCHAGEWSGLLNLGTGIWTPCYNIRGQKHNIFSDISKPIPFHPVGKGCKMPHCYNGHSFLSLGNIPEIDTYRFNQLRDRTDIDGNHWLKPETNDFYHQRLNDGIDMDYTFKDKMNRKIYKSTIFVDNIVKKVFGKNV